MKVNRLTALAALLGLAPAAFGDLTTYSQDFEALVLADPAALTADGHKVFANVFDPNGNYLYGYGTFDAPNGGGGFSAIAAALGGAYQGAQQLSIYSDYNNTDHGNGNYIEASVFHEQPVGALDVGSTWRFSFDYLKNPNVNNGDGDTTANAFIKVLKSSDGSYATLAYLVRDTSDASTSAWASSALDLLIDPAFAGELLQFGFASYATNYNDSSRVYDNLEFGMLGAPGIGQALCLGNPNSTGVSADLTITGSSAVVDNNVTLNVTQLPSNQFGYFLTSRENGFIYNTGGSEGHLCIGSGTIGRFSANVFNSGAGGTASFSPDLTAIPTSTTPVMAAAGETHYFQYWTRDVVGGMPTSNFSGATGVTFN